VPSGTPARLPRQDLGRNERESARPLRAASTGLRQAVSGIFISAAHKSSGKTTLTIGLCAALADRGTVVQSFKKGPDYIDPMWLAQASGRACYNLDPYLMGWDEIRTVFDGHAGRADFSIVEGNKGLFDGLALDGSNSNAAVAAHLGLPVVLVIDARGMTRGIAPLILGYQAFDSSIRIAGVILNNLGGARHEAKLRAVVEHYTDVPVVGAVHRDDRLAIVRARAWADSKLRGG
jgi:cobyrinic acid a,c-diamide synthase